MISPMLTLVLLQAISTRRWSADTKWSLNRIILATKWTTEGGVQTLSIATSTNPASHSFRPLCIPPLCTLLDERSSVVVNKNELVIIQRRFCFMTVIIHAGICAILSSSSWNRWIWTTFVRISHQCFGQGVSEHQMTGDLFRWHSNTENLVCIHFNEPKYRAEHSESPVMSSNFFF